MIDSTAGLQEAVRAARAAGAVGLDTEFVWERTYYPSLGVVQIGYPDERCELIDAPEISDWSPLGELMEDAGTVKILHDAQQDLIILNRFCGAVPRNVFDTQRSAGFVGLSSTIALRDLLKTLLKIRVDKSETRSNWLKRPLTPEQIHYAEEDVRYASRLMDAILKKAESWERRQWVIEENQMYEAPELYSERDPESEIPRVRGAGSMTNAQQNIVRALGAWREKKARERNLPRHFILSDDALVALMREPPASMEALVPVKGLGERVLKRNRRQIWEAIERGRRGDLPDLAETETGGRRGPRPDEGHEARVDLALAFVKGVALAAQLDPALVGNRAEITALVLDAENPDVREHRILRGWRGRFCGYPLLQLLRGERSLTVDPRTNFPVPSPAEAGPAGD